MEKLLQESVRNRAGVVPRRVTLREGKRKTRKQRAALQQPHPPPPILQASRAENTTRKEGSSGCDGNTHAEPVKRQKEQVNKPRSETGDTHTEHKTHMHTCKKKKSPSYGSWNTFYRGGLQ